MNYRWLTHVLSDRSTNINALWLAPSCINISWSALQQHVLISHNSRVRKNYFLNNYIDIQCKITFNIDNSTLTILPCSPSNHCISSCPTPQSAPEALAIHNTFVTNNTVTCKIYFLDILPQTMKMHRIMRKTSFVVLLCFSFYFILKYMILKNMVPINSFETR